MQYNIHFDFDNDGVSIVNWRPFVAGLMVTVSVLSFLKLFGIYLM